MNRHRRATLLACALCALAAVGATPAPPGQARFYHAANLAQSGHVAQAIREYRALVKDAPHDPFADDALAELAQLYEERLNDPRDALAAWEELARDYPESRLSRRAEARIKVLRQEMGPGDTGARALATFQDLLRHFSERGLDDTIARVETLLRTYPSAAVVPHATYWLASLYDKRGQPDRALRGYRQVARRWPRSEWAAEALKAQGDLLLGQDDFAGAARAYHALAGRGDPTLDSLAAASMVELRRYRGRVHLAWACWALLCLFVLGMVLESRRLAGSWGAALRSLLRPPLELVYLLPVAVLFMACGLTEYYALGRAILLVSLGGLVITWLSGANLRLAGDGPGRVTLRRAAVHALVAALAVGALFYIAIMQHRLLDQLLATMRFGPER